MKKAPSENWGPFALFCMNAAIGGHAYGHFQMVQVSLIVIGIGSCRLVQLRDIVGTTNMVQPEDIGQGQRFGMDFCKSVVEPRRRDISHAITVVAIVKFFGVAIF